MIRIVSNSIRSLSSLFLMTSTLLITTAFAVDSVNTSERSIEKLADGIYAIRHKDAPDTFPQGNTTVIIGDREVLVVDSCYLPSSAKEDIAQIRQWTNKPVRYLVNTHWHFDHTMGNGTYWEAFPGLAIIAHTETAKQIAGYDPGWFERFPKRGDDLQRQLDAGKDNNGKVLTDGDKEEYRKSIAGIMPVAGEFRNIVDRPPNVSFETELDIDLGNRRVEIKHLGRGNTAGDALVYLPSEKILITGDLVVYPVPYFYGGYPSEHAKTLREMSRLNFVTVVPGHGRVLRDDQSRRYIGQLTDLIELVVVKMSDEVHRVGAGAQRLPQVREDLMKSIDVADWRRKFAGEEKENQDAFDSTFAGLITAAHAEIWGR